MQTYRCSHLEGSLISFQSQADRGLVSNRPPFSISKLVAVPYGWLQKAEVGSQVAETCWRDCACQTRHSVSWCKTFSTLQVSDAWRPRTLGPENRQFKRVVAVQEPSLFSAERG